MNMQANQNVKLSENIILADADYIDLVAFRLSVQFERMIGRRIPKADLSRWAVDITLDGGLRADGKKHETQLVLIHDKDKKQMDNFSPSAYETELNAKAFLDEKLGEFLVNAYPTNNMVSKDDYLRDAIATIMEHEEVKRLMVVPNGEEGNSYDIVKQVLREASDDKRITVFAMQPMPGGNFRQEILGYSLMNALGIRAEELHGED